MRGPPPPGSPPRTPGPLHFLELLPGPVSGSLGWPSAQRRGPRGWAHHAPAPPLCPRRPLPCSRRSWLSPLMTSGSRVLPPTAGHSISQVCSELGGWPESWLAHGPPPSQPALCTNWTQAPAEPLTLRKPRVISRNSLIEVPRVGLSNSASSRRGAVSSPAPECGPSLMLHLMVTSLPCQSPLYTWGGGQRHPPCRRPLPRHPGPRRCRAGGPPADCPGSPAGRGWRTGRSSTRPCAGCTGPGTWSPR